MKLKSILLLSSAMAVLGTAHAQTHVNTSGKKYTLVEEATGAWCGYCPDGAQIIEQFIEPYGTSTNYPDAIIASFHNSHHSPYAPDDDMELTGDPFSSSTGYISGFPMGTVDRAPVSGNVGLNRGQWPGACATQLALTPKFDVQMDCTFDPATRKLDIKITGKCLVAPGTGNWNVNAYLVEDSILSSTTGNYSQHSYMNASGSVCYLTGNPSWFIGKGNPISPTSWYAHMNVVEKIFGANIWGDNLMSNPTVGMTASKTYSYTVPANFVGSNGGTGWVSNYKKMKVIGYIAKMGSTTSDRAIENVALAEVKDMWTSVLGVSNVTAAPMGEVKVYPNPANNFVKVEFSAGTPAETNITLTNAIGQVVYNNTFAASGAYFSEVIPTANLADGMYIMNVTSNGETSTKKVTISK